jgi:hypothetical protein
MISAMACQCQGIGAGVLLPVWVSAALLLARCNIATVALAGPGYLRQRPACLCAASRTTHMGPRSGTLLILYRHTESNVLRTTDASQFMGYTVEEYRQLSYDF